MNNISINGVYECSNLDRKILLNNGSLVVHKKNEEVLGVYLVVSFRDNKNKYENCRTSDYCSVIDLDSGQLVFEERCSRNSTERRLLRHLTRAGYSMPYDPDSKADDYKYKNMRIQIYKNGNYKMNLNLLDEYRSEVRRYH